MDDENGTVEYDEMYADTYLEETQTTAPTTGTRGDDLRPARAPRMIEE